MKRMLALLLCLVMCLSLVPAACAEDIEVIDIVDLEEAAPDGETDMIAIVETETTTGDEKLASKPVITTQPADKTAYIDTTAKFTVVATGATGYQWQYRKNSSSNWNNSTLTGATTATLSVKAVEVRNGFQYRCKVSNAAGTTYSDAATLTVSKKPVITTQPTSRTAAYNSTASFTVKATGATGYQWQYRAGSTGSWKDSTLSTAKTATLKVKATEGRNGLQYRCKVTNAAGTVNSKTATLKVKPGITTQPLSYTASYGATVKFKVTATLATGYQWQYRVGSTGSWKDSTLSTAKTATLSVKATEGRNGLQYRCKVTNAAGTTNSNTATLKTTGNQCGENLLWVLDSNGLLTVSGTGDMYYFCYPDPDDPESEDYPPPWDSTVKKVVLKSGVTSIGSLAFEDCSSLTSVTIPEGVTRIGEEAFSDCSALTSVKIPNSVTWIDNYAFIRCSSLKSVTIGSGVTWIGNYAFSQCDKLADVYYKGTKAQWSKIDTTVGNYDLLCATIHYNA